MNDIGNGASAPSRSSDVPASPSDVNSEWFTTVLRQSGVLDENTSVASITSAAVGAGLICESIRYELTYAGPAEKAPGSVVCKFPSPEPAYREMALGEALYQRETTFYGDLARGLNVRAPECTHLALDGSGNFVLVLEDLGPAEVGDHIAGCTLAQAQAIVDAAVGLHAPRWADDSLEQADWNVRGTWIPHVAESYPALFEKYAGEFGPHVGEAVLDIGRRFAPAIGQWFAEQPKPWTVTHGDYRLDNMLFDICGGAEAVGIVDWQTLLPAPGPVDIAYMIGGCLPTQLRRDHEESLVRRYHAGLLDNGVTGYSFDDCWAAYRHSAFLGYFMATYPAALVQRTERGDEMFRTWVERVSAQIYDLDALGLLPHA